MDTYLRAAFEALYAEDGLCLLARGLGLCRLYCKFIQAYTNCATPTLTHTLTHTSSTSMSSSSSSVGGEKRRLVFCLNALGEDEVIRDTLRASGVSEASSLPTVVTSDILSSERSLMYSRGGVFIASSRIIINDLLKGIVNASDICGFLVYDAHKIRETSIESFILRVFKQGNRSGFVKAFSDEPERVLGFGKTERILQLLFVKQMYLWPRFHHTIHTTLNESQPEVIELSQPLSTSMVTVQTSILVAMETILKELKKSNSKLDPASLTLENGVFHSFSDAIKAQLEPEWHKLSFTTKQLVADLKALRQLLDSLIRYDAITFYAYLLTIQESSMSSTIQSPSLWLTSTVAHNMFKCSKERVLRTVTLPENSTGDCTIFSVNGQKLVPVLEVPPKWKLVKEVLDEIKTDFRKNNEANSQSNHDLFRGRIVVIVKDDRSLLQLRDFLSAGNNGNDVLESRLRHFVTQQAAHIRQQLRGGRSTGSGSGGGKGGGKGSGRRGRGDQKWRAATERAGRGSGKSGPNSSSTPSFASAPITEAEFDRLSMDNKLLMMLEKELHSTPYGEVFPCTSVSAIRTGQSVVSDASSKRINDDKDRLPETRKKRRVSESEGVTTKPAMGQHDVDVEDDIDDDPSMLHASLLDPSLNITLLTHSQCVDEYCPLWDLTPSYIVLVDPEVTIIRLIETYQADLCSRQEARAPTKVYFLMYQDSIEEHRYSVSLQREKKSFEDLIQKKSHMVVTLPEIPGGRAEMRSSSSDREYALDSRTRRSGAGSSGSSVSSTSRVVVDIREFGSSLPSLLHLHHIEIFPVTLLVGDFILSPQICVERKGISDLFQSFASGRLYSQAEAMSRYYDLPCLLVEFAEKSSFSLQGQNDIPSDIHVGNICSKMSLLALAFPNLRFLWSRSPHATVEIFKSLKHNFEEADVDRAIQVGSDGVTSGEYADLGDTVADNIHMTVNDMLLALPGINGQNCRKVTDNVESIAHLSEMSVEKLTPLIGPSNAKKLFAFFNNST